MKRSQLCIFQNQKSICFGKGVRRTDEQSEPRAKESTYREEHCNTSAEKYRPKERKASEENVEEMYLEDKSNRTWYLTGSGN